MRIETDVLAVLSAAQVDGVQVFLTGQLDRNLYTRTAKVLQAAGGKWNRKAKAHVFDGDAADRIDKILLTGSIDIPKDEFEFFESQPAVVDALLDQITIQAGARVLEPNAGRAAIVRGVLARCPTAIVDCIELMPANVQYLVEHAGDRVRVKHADFLTVEPEPVYHLVAMNPPFSRQKDIHHVLHALKFLKPDGVLVSVMSAGVLFRTNRLTAEFRELVESRCGEITPLPDGAFKASGTMVNTVVVRVPA